MLPPSLRLVLGCAVVLLFVVAVVRAQRFPGVYLDEGSPFSPLLPGVPTGTAGFVGVTERGPLEPRLVESWSEFLHLYGGHTGVERSYLPHAVEGFFLNGGERAFVARVVPTAASTAGCDELGADELGGASRIVAIGPGGWGNGLAVTVTPAAGGNAESARFRVTIELFASAEGALDPEGRGRERQHRSLRVETFDGLGLEPSSPDFLVDVVRARSTLVRFERREAAEAEDAAVPRTRLAGLVEPRRFVLTGGRDGGAVAKEDFLGGERNGADGAVFRTALAGIAEVDEVAILSVPDAVRPELELNGALREQCESRTNRFGLVAFPAGETDPERLELPFHSAHTALYAPWLRVHDETTDTWVLVPPTGHVAGVFARTDKEQGVHRAPANQPVLGIQLQDRGGEGPLERVYTDREQDVLNPKGINLLRDFRARGMGVLVWGARTMSNDPEWRYLSVRRLASYIEASVERGLQHFAFEPDDRASRARIVESVSSFLHQLWKDGALQGATPREAFFVRCDETTTTVADLAADRLVGEVGFAPTRPAEFVVFRFSQRRGGKD